VIRALRSYQKELNADKVVVCWDRPEPILKAAELPEYKSNREWTEEKDNMYKQVPALKEMISLTRFTQAEAPGYEADDVVAYLARQLEIQGNTVYILTTDNDLCQVVTKNVSIFMPKKKDQKKHFKDPSWVQGQFGVRVENFLLWKSLTGDKSDNVAGVDLHADDIDSLRTVLAGEIVGDQEKLV